MSYFLLDVKMSLKLVRLSSLELKNDTFSALFCLFFFFAKLIKIISLIFSVKFYFFADNSSEFLWLTVLLKNNA